MLNFQILFGQFKNSSEVCSIKNKEKMNLTMRNMCHMMWKLPQSISIA